MKILYHHRIHSKDGQYVHIDEMVSALRRRGHEVVVVGPQIHDTGAAGTGTAVDWIRRMFPRALNEVLETAYALVAFRRLVAAHRAHRPDCLYERYNLFQPAGVWLRRRVGLPMLLEVNAPLVHERGRYGGLGFPALARWSERTTWTGADVVLPVTGVLAEHVRAAGVAEDRIAVIPNGIDKARFAGAPEPEAAKAALGLGGRLVLGFTGFVRSWHRLDRVVDLLAAERPGPPLHLLLVGDGPVRDELESRAAGLGIGDRLTITGVVDHARVADHVAAFDVALQPAVTPYASPLKMAEYMALARPIVAPATPNIREILDDGDNAVLFDPDDDGAFRRAIERLVDDPALRAKLGARARATIDERGLTWDRNAERVEGLFDRLLAAGQGG